jgi:adenylate cyclase
MLGHEPEAKAALAELLKVKPGLTIAAWEGIGAFFSDNSTFKQQFQGITEGLRKAGLAEK